MLIKSNVQVDQEDWSLKELQLLFALDDVEFINQTGQTDGFEEIFKNCFECAVKFYELYLNY